MATKFQIASKHIELREQFYEVKYGQFKRAYAHVRMFFMPESVIADASAALLHYIKDGYTAAKMRAEFA
jgi:hypothetical protein